MLAVAVGWALLTQLSFCIHMSSYTPSDNAHVLHVSHAERDWLGGVALHDLKH